MSHALDQSLGQFLHAGVLAGPAPNLAQIEWLSASRWKWYVGGHPLPNRDSLAAAADAVGMLQAANRDRSLIVFLISGGGSAMIEWPATSSITLSDLQDAHKTLVNCGASISEINSVRRAFSAIKGGKLAERAANCDQITLIISDVPADGEYNVASGPTIKPDSNAPTAPEVITRYDLRSRLPATVLEAIDNPREFPAESVSERKQFVLVSNKDALRGAAAAAGQRGFMVETAKDISDQQVAHGCVHLLNRLQKIRSQARSGSNICLISGGEFACPVNGDGIGGRNLETALRLAMWGADSRPGDEFVALCAGTDGIDGNSPAAGAVVDSTTIDRARALGLDPQEFLNRSDAFSFFDALGDAITIGPTGTNVRDLRILLSA
jgi:hydroxypyruvate reductase